MAFFDAGPRPAETLLDQLEIEERRDRRRLLLDLLVVHGEAARALARQRLEASVETPAERLRPPQLDLPPAPDPPPRRRAGRHRDRRGRALRRPRQPRLPRQGGAHLPRPDPPPARGRRRSSSLLGAWEAELERGRPRRGRARGGLGRPRPRRLRPRAPGRAPRAGAPSCDHALSRALRARGDHGDASPSWARRTCRAAPSVVETLLGEIRDEPAARACSAGSWARKDQDLPALVGALAGTRTPAGPRAARGGARSASGTGGRQGGRRARSRAGGARGAAHDAPATRASSTPTASRLCSTGWRRPRPRGTLNLLPKEGGGAPATIAFVARAPGRRALGAPRGRGGRLPALRAALRRAASPSTPSAVPPAGGGALPELPASSGKACAARASSSARAPSCPEELPLEATGDGARARWSTSPTTT